MTFDRKTNMIFYKKLEEYMKKYRQYYSDYYLDEIDFNFLNPHQSFFDSLDILNQIYSYIGVFDLVEDNVYDLFIRLIKERTDINRNILEVGCGLYPALAVRMSKHQKSGSITAVDSSLLPVEIKGISLLKEVFNKKFDIKPYDLIYGLYPCEATFDMIESANENDKDLCILACDCCLTEDGETDTIEEWIEYVDKFINYSIPSNRTYTIENIKKVGVPLITTRKR